ncbi:heavy-metal-associated domain-containing protein [Gordonia rubripertincta]|jgi:copper ion binding protein|uniref:Heavy-metal-associated domain-containing protein n=1 Tax=Gordonia rubripertincta TaxID=36822 RepID=A0ABT4MVU7_GORRU|nr:heavy-metal-associated domain-containing protein [Gordonia rubripertincta]MCZ4549877.1 heavy-metal-associated domain-containing protein [Gordonia rubripertincta]
MSAVTYTVVGMTCQHCVASVTEEVGEVPGVDRVDVDLESGGLRVQATEPVAREQIEAAVIEAGYRLA